MSDEKVVGAAEIAAPKKPDPAKKPVAKATLTDIAPPSRASQMATLVQTRMKDPESIMVLGKVNARPIPTISTGSIGLDIALGVGGFPQGRIIEIYGPESSGKTTLTLHALASCQARGGLATFIDAEHALDTSYAGKLGVNLDDLLISQPSCGEEALDIAIMIIENSRAGDMVVIDSVAALTPRAEIEGAIGDSHMGLQARLMGQALRKMAALVNTKQVTVIFINQLRMKIGVMFGNPETTTGGNALKFWASVRLDIRKIKTEKIGEEAVSNRVKVKVAKNKVAPPFRQVEFNIKFGEGIDYRTELLEFGAASGILSMSGSWYSFGDEKLGNGKEAVVKRLIESPDLEDQILKAVMGHYFPHRALKAS